MSDEPGWRFLPQSCCRQIVMTRLCDVRPLTNFSHVVTHSSGFPFRLHRTLPPIPSRPTSSSPDWIHEIKHDGFRLMARRDPIGEFGGITMSAARPRSRFPWSSPKPSKCKRGLLFLHIAAEIDVRLWHIASIERRTRPLGASELADYASLIRHTSCSEKVSMPNTVRLHHVLATKPDKVYRAFIEADAMAKWLPA